MLIYEIIPIFNRFHLYFLHHMAYMGISYGICGNWMCVYTVYYVYGFDKLTIFLLKKGRDVWPNMVTHTRNLCSAFIPSKCTHTVVSSSDARVGFFSNPRVPLLWNYLARPSPPRTTVSIFTTRPAPHPRPLNRHTRHCNVNENSLYFSLKVLGNIAL